MGKRLITSLLVMVASICTSIPTVAGGDLEKPEVVDVGEYYIEGLEIEAIA